MSSTKAFCTIITSDYLHFACSLRDSLISFDENINLVVLICCKENEFTLPQFADLRNISLLFTEELLEDEYGRRVYDKYFTTNINAFRWSMKSVLMMHLLEKNKFTKVIYVDSDIYFYNSFSFLFDYLDEFSIILSPHNRSLNFVADEENFKKNFTEGIYNGGFIGASTYSLAVLKWWAGACLHAFGKRIKDGLYDDQKYLDILPARFSEILSLQHLGCNVAEWNKTDCKRIMADGIVKINGKYEIVFIHFAEYTIIDILNDKDPLLKPHLETYSNNLKLYKPGFDLIAQYKSRIAQSSSINDTVIRKPLSIGQNLRLRLKKVLNTIFSS